MTKAGDKILNAIREARKTLTAPSSKILVGARQALSYARNELDEATIVVHVPDSGDKPE